MKIIIIVIGFFSASYFNTGICQVREINYDTSTFIIDSAQFNDGDYLLREKFRYGDWLVAFNDSFKIFLRYNNLKIALVKEYEVNSRDTDIIFFKNGIRNLKEIYANDTLSTIIQYRYPVSPIKSFVIIKKLFPNGNIQYESYRINDSDQESVFTETEWYPNKKIKGIQYHSFDTMGRAFYAGRNVLYSNDYFCPIIEKGITVDGYAYYNRITAIYRYTWFNNGNKQVTYNIKRGHTIEEVLFYENGNKQQVTRYKFRKSNLPYKCWSKNGKSFNYNDAGNKIKTIRYKKDKVIN